MAKQMPKGGRKGGTTFPRIELKQAVEFAKKLVAKTHTGAQNAEIILPGVFGNAGPEGKVRASALKQYGLLKGDAKGYEATDLAKSINASDKDEIVQHLRISCLRPNLFKTLYDTFKLDTVPKNKVRQQASNQNVHPDSLDECVTIFLASAAFAQVAEVTDDSVTFKEMPDTITNKSGLGEEGIKDQSKQTSDKDTSSAGVGTGKAKIEIKIDPSMDPEKLDKLLNVLKKHGQI